MARPGPPPKPTAIKRLEGNPGQKRLNENEPQPAVGCPMPAWLPVPARKHWKEHAPEAERVGVLTRVDVGQFAGYCIALANLESALKRLKPTKKNPAPSVQVSKSGYETPSGAEQDRRRAIDEIHKLAAGFGFDAASRSRISVTPKQTDDLDALLDDEPN